MNYRKDLFLLALCQALLLTNGITLIAVTGLVGREIAPDGTLATLALSAYVLATAITTVPASLFMQRHGRQRGFLLGGSMAILGSVTCGLSVVSTSFPGLILGCALLGVYNAFGQYYRFAAADIAPPEDRPRAISWTLAGGILGGVLGPETSKLTKDLLTPTFAGTYFALIAFAVLAMILVSIIQFPKASPSQRGAEGRPIADIARQPVFIVAVVSGLVAYGVMNLLMTATPLAMDVCRHPYPDTAFVLESHVIAMFAPSFFTGDLIRRFGVIRIISLGLVLMVTCTVIALAGVDLMNFWFALVLLGLGWNFMFVGGTTLLSQAHAPEEKARTQGLNDLFVFGTTALTSVSSGALIAATGWSTLNLFTLPLLVFSGLVILWYVAKIRASRKSVS